MLPLQPFPLEEPVVVHAVEVVCEGRHAQVVVDQSGKHTTQQLSVSHWIQLHHWEISDHLSHLSQQSNYFCVSCLLWPHWSRWVKVNLTLDSGKWRIFGYFIPFMWTQTRRVEHDFVVSWDVPGDTLLVIKRLRGAQSRANGPPHRKKSVHAQDTE